MEFRIADTFTDSLARLTGDEQKVVKTTAFDLQLNPANPGMKFHKLDKAKDKNFWSVRVNADIRIIVHQATGSLLLCYVDHHDKAYLWAACRKLQTHPKTGAAQLVEIRETVQEIFVPTYVDVEQPKPIKKTRQLFRDLSVEDLYGYGVPDEWLADVQAATEETILNVADHLPAEAAEALLELATGGTPRPAAIAPAMGNPFEHPDALRRFRVMTNVEELTQALEYPWEKWTVFLHPDQRQVVEKHYSGPARVSGSAGTGKTIVALHRAANLARVHAGSRVLLTTFSDTLAAALQAKLHRLLNHEESLQQRIVVRSLNSIGKELYREHVGEGEFCDRETVVDLIRAASSAVTELKFNMHFLVTEWEQVVDARQLASWEDYRDVPRLGRKTRLPEGQRKSLWTVYERVRNELTARRLITIANMFTRLAEVILQKGDSPFDFSVIDEAQDLSVSHLRFLAALGDNRPNSLFFSGDLGQRIFQEAFSWRSLGVDIRGRSKTLRVNYRMSHQIRTQADRLLGSEVTDVDGLSESRTDTISVFNGPVPQILAYKTEEDESEGVGHWLQGLVREGTSIDEIGVFVRSPAQLHRAVKAIQSTGLPYKILDELVETGEGFVSICTMHLAKGLEYRAVAVMACDDEIVPLQGRMEVVGDESDLLEVYQTERHLLYVACTRARDKLLVTAVRPVSEFLDDLIGKN